MIDGSLFTYMNAHSSAPRHNGPMANFTFICVLLIQWRALCATLSVLLTLYCICMSHSFYV